MKLIDLTHPFSAATPVYPGDSAPEFTVSATIDSNGYNEQKVKTALHISTHLDAPSHILKDGKSLADINIERFVGRGVLIDARGKDHVGVESLEGLDVRPGDIILVFTGFYKKFGSEEYFKKYPDVTEDFAKKIVEFGVKMVGSDTPSPDYLPHALRYILLEKEVLIIENLTNLEELLGVSEFEVWALPAKFDIDAAPVRVVARIRD